MILCNLILLPFKTSWISLTKSKINTILFILLRDISSCLFIYFNNPTMNIFMHRSLHPDDFPPIRQDSKYGIASAYGSRFQTYREIVCFP